MVVSVGRSIIAINQAVAVPLVNKTFLKNQICIWNFRRFHWIKLSISIYLCQQCHLCQWWCLSIGLRWHLTFILFRLRLSTRVCNNEAKLEYNRERSSMLYFICSVDLPVYTVRPDSYVHRISMDPIVPFNVSPLIHVRKVIILVMQMVQKHV